MVEMLQKPAWEWPWMTGMCVRTAQTCQRAFSDKQRGAGRKPALVFSLTLLELYLIMKSETNFGQCQSSGLSLHLVLHALLTHLRAFLNSTCRVDGGIHLLVMTN